MKNGDLLTAAEEAGFELLLTADKNIQYQQNLKGRKISLIVLGQSPWWLVRRHVFEIVAAVDDAKPGSYPEIEVPIPPRP